MKPGHPQEGWSSLVLSLPNLSPVCRKESPEERFWQELCSGMTHYVRQDALGFNPNLVNWLSNKEEVSLAAPKG